MSKTSIPVQKGNSISNPPTSKHMPFKDKVTERQKEVRDIRRGQTMEIIEPKKNK